MMANVIPIFARDTINIELRLKLPADVGRAAETARRSRERATVAEHGAARATTEAARALVGAGLSLRDAAEVLRLSHQRVDQLLRSAQGQRPCNGRCAYAKGTVAPR